MISYHPGGEVVFSGIVGGFYGSVVGAGLAPESIIGVGPVRTWKSRVTL